MQKLIHGLHHFQKHIFGTHRELFERLAHTQRPEVLLITCSDSRIVPNMMTNSGPGELFVLRNAGGIVPAYVPGPTSEVATIEFAIRQLAVSDVIVCGHTNCGAMRALFDEDLRKGMPALDAWLGHAEATRRLVEDHYSELQGEAKLKLAAQENVLVQLENLRTHPAIHAALAFRKVKLHGWMYKIETGEVHGYDPVEDQFVPLTAADASAAVG